MKQEPQLCEVLSFSNTSINEHMTLKNQEMPILLIILPKIGLMMTVLHGLSPLPIIRKTYTKIRDSQQKLSEVETIEHKNNLLKQISRQWIILGLVNSLTMGVFSFKRGDLLDSLIGSALGLFTNLLSLICLQITIGRFSQLMTILGAFTLYVFILHESASLERLKTLAMLANSISVTFGPLQILRRIIKEKGLDKQPLNLLQIWTATMKSVVWLSYGMIKQSKPHIVSHLLGLSLLSLILAQEYFFSKGMNPPYNIKAEKLIEDDTKSIKSGINSEVVSRRTSLELFQTNDDDAQSSDFSQDIVFSAQDLSETEEAEGVSG